MSTMHRPMPDFADALERHLRDAAVELARPSSTRSPAVAVPRPDAAGPGSAARTRHRRRAPRVLRRPLAAAGSLAVVALAVVAALLVSGSGGNTPQAFGGPLVLRTPLVTLPKFARPGGSAAFVLGPGSERITKGHRFATRGGDAYLYGNAAGWCLTIPDPLSSRPEVERGVSCVSMRDFERFGIAGALSNEREGTYVAAIPQGVRPPELTVGNGRPRALVPSDIGVVVVDAEGRSTVTRFDREGRRFVDPVVLPPSPPGGGVVRGTPLPEGVTIPRPTP